MAIFESYLLVESLGLTDQLLVKGEREGSMKEKLRGNSQESDLTCAA